MRSPKTPGFCDMTGGLLAHRQLVFAMTSREISARYKGSWLGIFWSLLTPILLLLVYTFVFGVIFQARWPQSHGVDENFTAMLFCGIIVHGVFAEVLTRAPKLIIENTNYVKRVIFPLEILSWISVLAALFHFLIAFVILVAFVVFYGNGITWLVLWLPVWMVGITLLMVGVAWFFSALGVYLRDLGYVAGFLAMVLIFLSPVFYPASAVPEGFAKVMTINPLTFYIESLRDLVVLGRLPEAAACIKAGVIALATFILGYAFFQRVRPGFADVL